MPGGGLEFWRPYSWQGGGGGSRGQGEWDEVLVDFRGHDSRPEFFGFALAKGWLHVEIKKGMKEDERQKRHEQEAFDGGGVVLQYMIGVPTLDQFIEAVVFDVPSLVPKTDGARHGNLRRRQRGYPHPIADLDLVLFVELAPHRIGFQGTNHPYGRLHLRPRTQ